MLNNYFKTERKEIEEMDPEKWSPLSYYLLLIRRVPGLIRAQA